MPVSLCSAIAPSPIDTECASRECLWHRSNRNPKMLSRALHHLKRLS